MAQRQGGFRPSTAFLKFLLVGAAAFVINEIALYGFYDSPLATALPGRDTRVDLWLFAHPDARLLIASLLAVETAIVFKFYAHEHWTFRDRLRNGWIGVRLVSFNLSCLAGTLVSVGAVNVLTPIFGLSPYITNVAGVCAGFMLNWITSAHLVWPHRETACPVPVRSHDG